MEKASPKQNYGVFPNATLSLDLHAGRGSSISRFKRFDKLIFIKIPGT